jgi:MFS superfamily sulfate permease-like transporter
LKRTSQKHHNNKGGNALSKELSNACQCCGKDQLVDGIIRLIPILGWLPKYKLGQYLHSDVITGLTVGIMVVPQGMAYATLAKVPPVYGLYSCFFSAFFYMFFGTSPHISIGEKIEKCYMI